MNPTLCIECGLPLLEPHSEPGLCLRCLIAAGMDATGGDIPQSDAFRPYRLICLLGEGGMGQVYLAEQLEPIKREVALKVLKPGGHSGELAARFVAERQSLASMDHPNIARVLDAGTSATGELYFAMEFIDGASITEYCDRMRMKFRDRVQLFIPVCMALHHAHQRNVVHRDVKPSNILVAEYDGNPIPKLIDFGIAITPSRWAQAGTRQTLPGQIVGTIEYMSPEQLLQSAGQGEATAGSDIYSLGVVLYELLIGALPLPWETMRDRPLLEVATLLRTSGPVAPGKRLATSNRLAEAAHNRQIDPARMRRQVRGEVEWILLKALDPEPRRRYESAAALAADLQSYLDREPVSAAAPSLFYRTRKMAVRRKGALILTILLIAVLAPVSRLYWQRRSLLRERQIAAATHVLPFTDLPGAEWSPSIAPDGARVAFAWNGPRADHFAIYIVDRPNGSPRRLTQSSLQDYSPAWSPDGRWIAYLEGVGANASVMLINPGGGLPRVAATTRNDAIRTSELAWLPDSRHLLFPYRNGIGILDTVTAGTRSLVSGGAAGPDFQPSVGPDGHTVAFVRDSSSTSSTPCLLNLESDGRSAGKPQCLHIAGFEHATIDYPILLSDQSLLFVSSRGGQNRFWRVPDRGRGDAELMGELGEGVMMPALSYRHRRLLFSRSVIDADIWCMDIPQREGQALNTRPLITSLRREQEAQYSPDGRRIVFVSNRSGYDELWLANADGNDAVQLTRFESASVLGSPRWSPDGSEIVFDSRAEGQPEIYSLRLVGGTPRRLTHHPAIDVTPSFSSDGRWIYFCSDRSGRRQIYRMPSSGGAAVPVTQVPSFAPVASPDGQWLYYARARADISDLLRMPIGGGREELVARNVPDRAFAVSPLGVYVLTAEQGMRSFRLTFVDHRTGSSRLLATFTQRLFHGFSISPDERHLLYTAFAQNGGLMRVENFLP